MLKDILKCVNMRFHVESFDRQRIHIAEVSYTNGAYLIWEYCYSSLKHKNTTQWPTYHWTTSEIGEHNIFLEQV